MTGHYRRDTLDLMQGEGAEGDEDIQQLVRKLRRLVQRGGRFRVWRWIGSWRDF